MLDLESVNKSDLQNGTAVPLEESWSHPVAVVIISLTYVGFNLATSMSTNCLLIIIINYSPSLKTPANSHLINICANNLVLCLCMAISIVSMIVPTDTDGKINILTGFYVFLITNCFLQYLGTFASIGHYRSRIIRAPSMSMRLRRQIIARSLTSSWAVSLVMSLMVCLCHVEDDMYACLTLNPFKKKFLLCIDDVVIPVKRLTVMALLVLVFFVICIIIVTAYIRVFKALSQGGPFGRNRILPLSRSFSIPSETGEVQTQIACIYTENGPVNDPDKHIYAVSGHRSIKGSEHIVHFQKHDQINVLSFEDILALENPILATKLRRQILHKRPLYLTRSNTSNTSMKSKGPEFTDISAGADLQRYQNHKNRSALKNHFIKRDRVGFKSATKNSIVMLLSFLVCSLPMFVCLFPNILLHTKQNQRVLLLLFTVMAFYLNAPLYPLWYLIHNNRVRKCLNRVLETLLVKLNFRR